ncbi:unnamed protein product, partial [Medioppia subpectinata]
MNRKSTYFKRRIQVYNLLNRPRGVWAFIYHIFVFLLVFFCLIMTVLSTDTNFETITWEVLILIETCMVVGFGIEFIVRLWASGCKLEYKGWCGKLKFLRNPLRLGDICLIIVSIVLLQVGPADGHLVFDGFAVRGFHRVFQVIQMIKSERQFRPASILMSVLSSQREQLIITVYIGFIVLCFMAFLIYLVENGVNEYFDTIADSFWWAVSANRYPFPSFPSLALLNIQEFPVTWAGKLITCIFTILGVSIFALPAGIIGTGLAINVSEEQRVERRIKRKVPAAVLIQRCWRYYAANPQSRSVATWTLHKKHCDMLSNAERNGIRFIRMVQFVLARQTWESLRQRPDIQDVLDQYQTGHSSLLYRIKEIQHDLNLIVGKVHTNGAKMVESKAGLIDRIERLERTHRDLDRKLDVNFELILSALNDRSVRSEYNLMRNDVSARGCGETRIDSHLQSVINGWPQLAIYKGITFNTPIISSLGSPLGNCAIGVGLGGVYEGVVYTMAILLLCHSFLV